jgi:hypothetical protein
LSGPVGTEFAAAPIGNKPSVRSFFVTAPARVVGLIQGIYFGLVMGVVYGFQDRNWIVAAISGLFAGVLYGVFMTIATGRRRITIRSVIDPVSDRNVAAVYRASLKGPVPQDIETREATARLIQYRLKRISRTRGSTLLVFGLLTLLAIYLAVQSGPIWLLAVVLFASFVPLTYWQTNRIRQRARLFGISSTDLT